MERPLAGGGKQRRGGAGFSGRIPEKWLAGGEGKEGEEIEEVRVHRWVVLGCGEALGGSGSGLPWWRSGETRAVWAEGNRPRSFSMARRWR